jgi:glycosyltransferase involved in cell wall biosynthesis
VPRRATAARSARTFLASIIIATRDRADLLRRCVESFMGVSDKSDFEVIVVDNGSREETTRTYLAEITRDAVFACSSDRARSIFPRRVTMRRLKRGQTRWYFSTTIRRRCRLAGSNA